jgi:hypothetical protein
VSLVAAHEYVISGPVAKNILEMYFIGLEILCFLVNLQIQDLAAMT